MFFTTRSEYGVRLLVALGQEAADGRPRSLKHLAEAEELPLAYLESVAARLRRAGLVEATRGAHGGYRLARDPVDITMDEVVLALEGTVVPMACFDPDPDQQARVHCSHAVDEAGPCATKYLWTRVQGGVVRALHDTTLADLVAFSTRTPFPVAPPLAVPSLAKELHA